MLEILCRITPKRTLPIPIHRFSTQPGRDQDNKCTFLNFECWETNFISALDSQEIKENEEKIYHYAWFSENLRKSGREKKYKVHLNEKKK